MKDNKKVSDYFACNVFNDNVMAHKLPKDVYKKLKKTIEDGLSLDPSIAGVVAHAMKEWAIERGATHYTHWFQPLTGVTAEKHESFVAPADKSGRVIEAFSAKELTKGESDASSFPSGGLRATFEARGYTTWDCTSPAFLREDEIGVTLCIPTAFCSYGGEALDEKTPLLRSMQVINEQSLRLLRLFGNNNAKRVVPCVGAEQEYFLIDRDKYLKRKDLIYTGRTLFGSMPPKGQEMEDHYYGTIGSRASLFMKDLNEELWKLGVPAKTQHNEVAPGQHELAPIFEEVNLAVDHNQMIMETMKRVARKHSLTCLLHEKPFAGVNGSGKHNNWSLMSDDGINLLNPGDTPHENFQFLLVLACILKAVDRHADLLREAAAIAGNDHRLGANEAPPAIISVFLGDQLEDVIDQLCETGEATRSKKGGILKTGVNTILEFEKDATDRNRTSPFAFTNNKFEFRMVGSSDSITGVNIVLNTIVAQSFKEACDELENAEDFNIALHDMIKKLFVDHKRIVFNGNGYSQAWVEEAGKRGLQNIKSTVEAISALTKEKSVKLFEEFGVFTGTELKSREEIEYENYSKIINVEAKAMSLIAGKYIIPSVIAYIKELSDAYNSIKLSLPENNFRTNLNLLQKCCELLDEAGECIEILNKDIERVSNIKSVKDRAFESYNVLVDDMKKLRKPIDELELVVDKKHWPMPSYGDLMFEL